MQEILTLVLVTYAYIVSSERSSRARATTFNADQNAPLPNITIAIASVNSFSPDYCRRHVA